MVYSGTALSYDIYFKYLLLPTLVFVSHVLFMSLSYGRASFLGQKFKGTLFSIFSFFSRIGNPLYSCVTPYSLKVFP